jgi:hypothetical protein
MTLRRETIVPALAILVIVAALPFAIAETIETGRVYLFSRQFLEELPRRFTGPGRFRFILQPMMAIVLGMRGGLADAKTGNPLYLFGLLFNHSRRRELLRSGAAAVSTLFGLAGYVHAEEAVCPPRGKPRVGLLPALLICVPTLPNFRLGVSC